MRFSKLPIVFVSALPFVVFGIFLSAQNHAKNFTLISPTGLTTVYSVEDQNQEMLVLNDLAQLFQLDVSEDSRDGTLTVTYRGKSILLTEDQQLVSVTGRLVSLQTAPRRIQNRWIVPLDFLNRALAQIHDETIELRLRSRLILVGNVQVPRISLRYSSFPEGERLSFEITPRTDYEIIEAPGRLIVNFQADGIDLTQLPPLGTLVTNLEQVSKEPKLEIELDTSYNSFSESSKVIANNGIEINIELQTNTQKTERSTLDTSTSLLSTELLPVPTDLLPTLSTSPTIQVIVIDPGHGGNDLGSHREDEVNEKDITLNVAKRLRVAIENRLGLNVILTRDQDEVVPLDERAAIANNNKADLFISLHLNASPRPAASGPEVFYLSLADYGNEAQELAARLEQRVPVIGGGSREINLIQWDMAQVRYVKQSEEFANLVEQELRKRLSMNDQAVKQAPFRVLVGANMPAVLIEMGSISDVNNEKSLTSSRMQNQIVESIIDSIIRFRDNIERMRYAIIESPERND